MVRSVAKRRVSNHWIAFTRHLAAYARKEGPMTTPPEMVSHSRRSQAPAYAGATGSHRLFAQNRHAPHEAPLVGAEVGAGVERAAVVPHQQLPGLPDVLVDELAPLLVIEQEAQELLA